MRAGKEGDRIKMGYCVDVQGKRMNDIIIRETILNADFETAFMTVCRFITKRNLQQLHRKIIHHKSVNMKTLDLAPRGFGKSTVGDVDYCITEILRNPNIRIMIGSKTQGQAEAFLKEIRTHFEMNDDLKRIFGDLKGDKWTDKEFTVANRSVIKKEATVTALGASGAVVSKHFDVIIADDIVGFENARTETQRTKLREWFYSSLEPTLEPEGKFHVLGTRYHPLDLYQDMMNSNNYHVQIQQAINIYDENRKTHQKLKAKGELPTEVKHGQEFSLWEHKFTYDILKKKREEAGSIIFGMQYQNDVELAKGNIFKADYFRHFEEYKIEKDMVFVKYFNKVKQASEWRAVKVYIGADLAISEKQSADYFVMMAIGIDEQGNIFVLDYIKERLTFDQQYNAVVRYGYDKFPMAERIGIEGVAYQQALIQELRRGTTLPILQINTNKDKVSRAMRRSALFENGKVYFRENMNELEECLLLFPDVEHDDLFDGLDFAITVSESANNARVLDRKLFNI